MDLPNSYTQSYINYGTLITDDIRINNIFAETIINHLSDDYVGLDIGSADGVFGDQIMAKCDKVK